MTTVNDLWVPSDELLLTDPIASAKVEHPHLPNLAEPDPENAPPVGYSVGMGMAAGDDDNTLDDPDDTGSIADL